MVKLKTGRHTSVIKEARKAKKRAKRNAANKSKLRTSVKKVETAVKNNSLKDATKLLSIAFSEFDKATKKNILHLKAASNQKSRLSKLVLKIHS